MSDGPSFRRHRITKSDFRPCSARLPRSQAPFCLCALRVVSNHAEGTFERLRYCLGGDRPSQTARLKLSPIPLLRESRLEVRAAKGGIPQATPAKLTPRVQCLPPILYMTDQNPISSYSKAPRGLLVLMRITGVFTRCTVSPNPVLRQCPDRYAIHAGQNLPDKGFRYLRTVIVTAAIHRGLSSELRKPYSSLTPPRNLPALGRHQTLYVGSRLSRVLCF